MVNPSWKRYGNLSHITVATYNVHGYVGTDGRFDPGRVARLVRELNAEVIGLQEVCASSETGGWGAHMEYLSEISGLQVLPGPTMVREDSDFGNVLLTNFPILQTDSVDLSVFGREPRGAIDAILEIKKRPVRVIVTHLGLRGKERLCRTELLACKVEQGRNPLLILLGDINEWYPLSRSLRYLNRCFGKSSVRPTFPARWPIFPLDRIWVCPSNALLRVWTHRNPLSPGRLPIIFPSRPRSASWNQLNRDAVGRRIIFTDPHSLPRSWGSHP